MTPRFETVQNLLKKLPGLGFRSAERVALHLLVEKPEMLAPLLSALADAAQHIGRCPRCGNLCDDGVCAICADERRDTSRVCIVERIPDLAAIERSGAYRGAYHVLHGKLSPIHGVHPEHLNLPPLIQRLEEGGVEEIILALPNDIEGEATCHYLIEEVIGERGLAVTRIGFGLPSGGGIPFADATTLKSALEGRRRFE